MSDPNDSEWLVPLRRAVESERKRDVDALRLDASERNALIRVALDASGRSAKARAWVRWVLPIGAIAAAAAVVLVMRLPSHEADIVPAYRAELVGVDTARGGAPKSRLPVANGFPFHVVLRPEGEHGAHPPHAYVFVATPGGVRDVANVAVQVSTSGSVLVAGNGDAIADAQSLVIVLAKRETSVTSLRSILERIDAAAAQMTLPEERGMPAAQVFQIPIEHVDPR